MSDDCRCDQGDTDTDAAEIDDGENDPVAGGPPLDEVLDCLSSSTRRQVLYHLRDAEIASVEALAKHVVAEETGSSPEEVPDDRRERAEAKLVHVHLPKLSGSSVVEFDHRSKTVRYTEPPRLVTRVLEAIERLEDLG